jgi:hypothetical protein
MYDVIRLNQVAFENLGASPQLECWNTGIME